MRTLTRTLIAAASLLAFLVLGCSVDQPGHPELTVVQPTGGAVFTNYVAVGNSLTAGYMDAGLHLAGQSNSFPALLASVMGYNMLDPSAARYFAQPLLSHPGVGSSSTGDPSVVAGVLYWTGTGIDVVGTTPAAAVPGLLLTAQYPVAFNNLGVPGATVQDVSQALTAATSQSGTNSYFNLVLRNPTFGDVSMLGQAVGRGPTLITVWIGNNDILSGAMTGEPVVGTNMTPAFAYAAMLDALLTEIETGIEARTGYLPTIALANIPGDLPYFMPTALFETVIGSAIPYEETSPVRVRFPAVSYVSGGGTLPLPETYTFDAGEWTVVTDLIAEYNIAIADIAADHDAILVDINDLVARLSGGGVGGLDASLFILNPNPSAPTTAFSLDGIHFNNKGYGLVANEFITAINTELGTALPSIPVAGLVWDPTYSAFTGGKAAAPADGLLSPAAARALEAMFR